MKKIMMVLMLLISIGAYSQQPAGRITVLDETEYVPSGKTAFRIVTSNDSVYYHLVKDFLNKGKSLRLVHSKKKDRGGDYWEHTFYFKNDYYNDIVTFVNNFEKSNKKK